MSGVSTNIFEIMRSTMTELEHSPSLTPEEANRLQQIVLRLAAELEVINVEPLTSTIAGEQ